MAQQRKKSTRTRTSAKGRARSAGDEALKRLQDSVDASEEAAKQLRKEMSRGSRELLTDVETTLKDARKNLRRVSGRVAKDLEDVRKAAAGKRTTQRRSTGKKTTQRRSAGKKTTQRRSAGKAGSSRSKRTAKK
jgi:flagellar hook-basal body complex protein FliE